MTSLLSQDQKERSSGRQSFMNALERVYPGCRGVVDTAAWNRILTACAEDPAPESFSDNVALRLEELCLPGFLAELGRLEWTIHKVMTGKQRVPSEVNKLGVNPTLQLLQLSWKHLPSILNGKNHASFQTPEPGEEFVLIWQDPNTGQMRVKAASDEDLLVLKIVVEEIDPKEVATRGDLPVGSIHTAIRRAASGGLIMAPQSRIRRDTADFPAAGNPDKGFVSATVFTLQWHVTQACDLHCKHCYDRSNRSPLKLDRGVRILDDFLEFCEDRHVRGQVSFTGGNPLLYPHLSELYRAASERGLDVAILGNPSTLEQMEELLAIHRPVFFQVSLEGLKEHNDMIRGAGHFERVIQFLTLLRSLNIFSRVMLTLTKGNMGQVLPLAETLRGLTDDFTFSRLSMVGEGANLRLPLPDDFATFLDDYTRASKSNPVMGWKDNLINIVCRRQGMEPFGGCTGYGCGAAFNFIAVLSDGEAHACRKFPSPIGNVFNQSIAEIYDSEIAGKYRRGPRACRSCSIHLICRGCLAVAYSHGLDVFEDRDPYCFMAQAGTKTPR